MTILTRLEQWKEQGKISSEQHAHLAALSRGEPFSLFLELNVLLYAGVLAFVAGLGWTVSTWSRQLGDVLSMASWAERHGRSTSKVGKVVSGIRSTVAPERMFFEIVP